MRIMRLFFIVAIFVTNITITFCSDDDFAQPKTLEELKQLLFPNTTAQLRRTDNLMYDNYIYDNNRRLQTSTATPTMKPTQKAKYPCTICRGLDACKILEGYQIEEVYYPKNLEQLETCHVIESLGKRIQKQIFGTGRTFRDTPQCREMVMQYLCLFYGSDNPMYVNHCIDQEDVSDPNPKNHRVAPRPPCKSFCVQIATVCANDPDFYILTCNEIKCPPTQDECTPDPMLDKQVLAANLGCSVPYYFNPYFRNAAFSNFGFQSMLFSIICGLVCIFQFLF